MSSTDPGSFSYAIFTLSIGDARNRVVPVGVALWSPQRRWVQVKFVEEREKLSGFKQSDHYPFVRLVRDKVRHWIRTGKLPHTAERFPPFDDRWWEHARNLLIHNVLLSEPRPIDCINPEEELDPLFESIVAAYRPARVSRSRIDGQIKKCLNGLGDSFKSRQSVPGFGGRPVPVLRVYKGRDAWIVIEGVNLASNQAESQSDATASKLMRIRASLKGRCRFIIGYIASPDGLNGDRVLVEWLRSTTDAQTFDLMKQREAFRHKAQELVAKASGQESLFEPTY